MRKSPFISGIHYLATGKPSIKKRNLFLFLYPVFMLISSITFGQTPRTITGTVKNEKGVPLSAVSISVKGSKLGTITDANGQYSLKVPEGKNTLVISNTGFSTREISIKGLNSLDVQLESLATQMGM